MMIGSRMRYHPGEGGGGGEPPAPPATPKPPDRPPENWAAEAARKTEELAATRTRLQELERKEAERTEAARVAAEAEAKRRGEHESIIASRDAELKATRDRLAEYERQEQEQRTVAAASLDAALSARTDADAVRLQCSTWGGSDPRRQLDYYRAHYGQQPAPKPAPGGGSPPPDGAAGDEPLPQLTADQRRLCESHGWDQKAYAQGLQRSQRQAPSIWADADPGVR